MIDEPQRLQKPEPSGTLFPHREQNVPNPEDGGSDAFWDDGVAEGAFSMNLVIGGIGPESFFGKGRAAEG